MKAKLAEVSFIPVFLAPFGLVWPEAQPVVDVRVAPPAVRENTRARAIAPTCSSPRFHQQRADLDFHLHHLADQQVG